MAVIPNLIQPRNFELVRDKIELILSDELANQAVLAGDPLLSPTVFKERFVPIDKVNMPALNVMLSRGNSPSQTTVDSDNLYTYFIDVYMSAKSTASDNGDTLAATRLHRVLGLIKAILEDTRYITLGFARPSIENTNVQGIDIADPKNGQDAYSVIMGRVTLVVRVTESVELVEALPIGEFNTKVRLDETNKGYEYKGGVEEPQIVHQDSFTDTNGTLLENHTPEVGSYTNCVWAVCDLTINNNSVGAKSSSLGVEPLLTDVAEIDVIISFKASQLPTVDNDTIVLRYRDNSVMGGQFIISRLSGVNTWLHSFSGSFSESGTYSLDDEFRLDIKGDEHKLYINDVLIHNSIDASVAGDRVSLIAGSVFVSAANLRIDDLLITTNP